MPAERQFKVMVSAETEQALDAQALALGFHNSNATAAVFVHALARVPAAKVFEALAKVRAYHVTEYKRGSR